MIVELWHNAHKKASELLMSETEKLAVGYISFIGNYRENEILARFSLENPQVLLYPVSYTHLDVYKRQV